VDFQIPPETPPAIIVLFVPSERSTTIARVLPPRSNGPASFQLNANAFNPFANLSSDFGNLEANAISFSRIFLG